MRWKDLVKKYGVKTAKKMYKKEEEGQEIDVVSSFCAETEKEVKIDSIDFFKNEWLEKFELGEYKELLYEEKGKKFLVSRIK